MSRCGRARLASFLIVSVVLSITLLTGGRPAVAGQPLYHASWALIIGINKYPNLPPERELTYAVSDAESMKKLLVETYRIPENHVVLLTDEQATRKSILDALNDLTDSKKVSKEDRVLVYFSGHGVTVNAALVEKGEIGFLVPHDAAIDLNDMTNAAPFRRSCIPMTEVWDVAKLIPAKHVLFLVDACYSGLAAETRALPTPTGDMDLWSKTPARQIITAGTKGQESWEKPEWGHGAFTYKLLEFLRAKAQSARPEAVATACDIYAYVRTGVPRLTEGKQTPKLADFGTNGEFLFVPEGYGSEDREKKHDQQIIDREKPTIEILEPEQFRGLKTRGLKVEPRNDATTIALRGIAKDNVSVTAVRLEGESLALTPAGERGLAVVGWQSAKAVEFSGKIHLDPGEKKSVRLEAQDAAENLASVVLIFELPELPKPEKPKPPVTAQPTQADNPAGYEFVRIPAGEGVAAFDIGKYDVTVAQFRKFVEAKGYKTTAETQGWSFGWNGGSNWGKVNGLNWKFGPSLNELAQDNHPVVNVSWEDAKAFCEWVGGRLPTDEEWEHAARGGLQGKKYVWGDEWPPPPGSGNFADVTAKRKYADSTIIEGYDDGYADTSPVGSFKPNGYGLFDMAGNVSPWVDGDAGNGRHTSCGGSFHDCTPVILSVGAGVQRQSVRRDFGIRVARTQ